MSIKIIFIIPYILLAVFDIKSMKTHTTFYSSKYKSYYIGNKDSIRLVVDQGSKEWLDLRKGNSDSKNDNISKCIGSSNAGEFIGIGYGTPQDAYYKAMDIKSEYYEYEEYKESLSTKYMDHGNKYECIGAYVYNILTGERCYNGYFWKYKSKAHRTHCWDRFACSPDRCLLFGNHSLYCNNEDGVTLTPNAYLKGCLEIKSPYNKMYSYVPKTHVCQMQFQAMVTNVPYVDYCAVHIDPEEDELKEVFCARVYKNNKYIKWMMTMLNKASNCLYNEVIPDWDEYNGTIPTCTIDIMYKAPLDTVSRSDIINELDNNKYNNLDW